MLIKAQTFMNYHETTIKSYCMITLLKHTRKRQTKQRRQLIEAKKFAKYLDLDERMECYSGQGAFMTLKGHKTNFKNNTKCRLINPSKSEVGLVNKHYLNSSIGKVAEKKWC